MGEDESVDAFTSRVVILANYICALGEDAIDSSVVHWFLHASPCQYL